MAPSAEEQRADRIAFAISELKSWWGYPGSPIQVVVEELERTTHGMVVDGDLLRDVIADAVPQMIADSAARAIGDAALDGALRAGMTVLHGPDAEPRLLAAGPVNEFSVRAATGASFGHAERRGDSPIGHQLRIARQALATATALIEAAPNSAAPIRVDRPEATR